MPYANPEKRRAAVRESQRRRRAGNGKPSRQPLPELAELRYQTARDVLALLNSQVEKVEGDRKLGTVERARTIGYLATVLLRAVEQADVLERIAALEKAVSGRKGTLR